MGKNPVSRCSITLYLETAQPLSNLKDRIVLIPKSDPIPDHDRWHHVRASC